MTDPNENDGWADLYSDLGIDVPASPPKAAPPEPEPVEEIELVAAPEDAESEADEEFAGGLDEGDESEDDGAPEGATSEEGDPGQKKRRRRRRRRKKKGPGEGTEADATPEAEPELAAVAASTEDEGEFAAEDDESVEGASPEATREIISNWNVPSWQEIVAGLYRPDR